MWMTPEHHSAPLNRCSCTGIKAHGQQIRDREATMARVARSPRDAPRMAASPVRVVDVVPLGTGQGRLALKFLQPLSAGGGRCRSVALRVLQHGPTHLVGAFLDVDGVATRGIVSPTSFD